MPKATLTPAQRRQPSIADDTIPRTPDDRSAAVEEWLELLHSAGIDTSVSLASTHDAIGRVEALARRAREARQVAASEARASAKRLASDPEAAPRTATAVEDYSAALGIAQTAVWGTFCAANLAAIIGPAHKASVTAILAIAAQIPPEVGDITAAARARCSDAWVDLEESIVEYEVLVWLWCNLAAQHAIASGPGVKSGRHRTHTPLDILYSEPAAAFRASAAANYAGLPHQWRVFHIVSAGKPVLGRLTATRPQPGDPLAKEVFDLADELRELHRPGTRPSPRPPSAMASADA